MSAIYLIACGAMLVIATSCFDGEYKGRTVTPLKPRVTPENRVGVTAQTQCPCGFQAAVTPVTPVTCQKTEGQVKNTKRSLKWASAT